MQWVLLKKKFLQKRIRFMEERPEFIRWKKWDSTKPFNSFRIILIGIKYLLMRFLVVFRIIWNNLTAIWHLQRISRKIFSLRAVHCIAKWNFFCDKNWEKHHYTIPSLRLSLLVIPNSMKSAWNRWWMILRKQVYIWKIWLNWKLSNGSFLFLMG